MTAPLLAGRTVAELRALAEAAWKGPWAARTFEIDCPCPNGVDCGDSHTCEEVEAPEEYPNGAPGAPAAAGEGQCVVQISVPGLETFSKPTAVFIAAAREALPAALDALEAAHHWQDEPTPEDADIDRAFPTRSGRHDLYDEAQRLVSARRSKGSLVALVNWLLHREDEADARQTASETLCREMNDAAVREQRRAEAAEARAEAAEAHVAALRKALSYYVDTIGDDGVDVGGVARAALAAMAGRGA